MSTLLLRLAAPMQSWGVEVRYDVCSTRREPTKSGIIGLVASALGVPREDSEALSALRALKVGIRVDREGTLVRDYHTVRGEKSAYVTQRYYLCDALFLAGLSGPDDLLTRIASAIESPAFPLFLGRRSCPPEGCVVLGIRPEPLEAALRAEPWLQPGWRRGKGENRLRLVLDSDDPGAPIQRDLPLSFNPRYRSYGFRGVRESAMPIQPRPEPGTDHDPMAELEAKA